MDYPHDPHRHHNHHHHDRREEREEYPPPPFHGGNEPPPPFYGRNEPPPPFYGRNEPPPPFFGRNEPPPPFHGRNEHPPPFPPPTEVYHTSHHGPGRDDYPAPPPPNIPAYSGPPRSGEDYGPPHHGEDHHHHRPHIPSFGHHEAPHGGGRPEFANKPTVRVYSKAGTNFSLAIRDGHVILTRSNPSDPSQHWIKDEKFSTRVKDEEGLPSFALVNKATGQAIKHATGPSHPVKLIPYNPDVLDESILWTESKDTGDNYRAIRMVNNIRLNMDAWHGDKDHGGVRDGTTISLWEWTKGDNQRWKIVPYCKSP